MLHSDLLGAEPGRLGSLFVTLGRAEGGAIPT